MGNIQDPQYDTTDSPNELNCSWMSHIDDSVSLTEISIPGTHHSLALHGGAIPECQSWCLSKQLEAGIRWLDVRARHYQDGLPIHHGVVYQHYNLDDVFRDCISFMKKYPDETVIMRLNDDHEAAENTPGETMGDTVETYIADRGGDERFWSSSRMPTLGEARGKIVILDDYPDAKISRVDYNNPAKLDIDDKYQVCCCCKCNKFTMDDKWKSVRTHLDKAKDGDKSKMFLTFCSAYKFPFAYTVAKNINYKVYDHITGAKHRWGVVATDYPGTGLIKRIIDSNF